MGFSPCGRVFGVIDLHRRLIRLISAGKANRYEEQEYRNRHLPLDPKNPTQMTGEQILALNRLSDEKIDYREIPPLQGRQWRTPGALFPAENKQQLTLRLDADVIAFFRSTGRRYQSRMKAVLRDHVLAHRKAG